MASSPLPIAAAPSGQPAPDQDQGAERAIYRLSSPIKALRIGFEIDLHVLEMREIGAPDMPLLDRYQGQPVALAMNMVAALCGIDVDEIDQLAPADCAMLAEDALWQVEQFTASIGLPPHFFLQPRSEGETA